MKFLLTLLLLTTPASAASLDGASLSFVYALPFIGLLLSIAAGPVLFPHLWEHHYGKFAFLWGALTCLLLVMNSGFSPSLNAVLHTLTLEYISFIILLFALFCVAGGIYLQGNLHGSPLMNTGLLAAGTFLASFVGTTGASIIMIRPLLRANDNRHYNVHTVVFFIFLVSNIGGSLTALGDPPLFIGFLKGVDFFWTLKAMWKMTLTATLILLILFFVMDSYFYKKEEGKAPLYDPTPDSRFKIRGNLNIFLLGAIIACILISASVKTGVEFKFSFGTLALENIVRDIALLFIGLAALKFSNPRHYQLNHFSLAPINEVAKLFLSIFICMIPVLAMLQAGSKGAFAPLIALVSDANGAPKPAMYFWASGILSSFLDNAPTYLVFYELAGGKAEVLMSSLAQTLLAISAGSVFMGANSYIGNAPNFMVYAIAKDKGVRMPSFFGYLLWSGGILIPLFIVLTLIFF